MIQLFTYKMKAGTSSTDHFLQSTRTRPTGQFCPPLLYSFPTAPQQDMFLHTTTTHFHLFRQSGPPFQTDWPTQERRAAHDSPRPCPYTRPILPHGPGPGAPSMDKSHTVLLARRPASWGRCLLENTTLLFPRYDLKGKFILLYQLRQKTQTVLWTSLQIVSFY